MTIPLTKEIVMSAYELNRRVPPFSRWKLPQAEMIKWTISKSPKHFAQYWWDGDHNIEVSERAIGYLPLLLEKLQHEMIHMHLRITKQESKNGGANVHNAAFRKYATRVCKIHGWDPKAFY